VTCSAPESIVAFFAVHARLRLPGRTRQEALPASLPAAWTNVSREVGGLSGADAEPSKRVALVVADGGGWQGDLSVSHVKLGDVLEAQGDLGEMLGAYRAALAIRERLAATDPGWQRDLAVSHERLGNVLEAQGDLGGALAAYRAALAIAEQQAAADPGTTSGQRDLAVSSFKLAYLCRRTGDHTGEATYLQRCHDVLRHMRAQGMYLDAPLAQLLAQLEERGNLGGSRAGPELPSGAAGVSTPHPGADPERAVRLNAEYQRAMAQWRALPLWKRWRTKRPTPPTGI